jgi:hypothetical protein
MRRGKWRNTMDIITLFVVIALEIFGQGVGE